MAKKVRKPTQPATEKASRNVSHTATRNGTQTAVRKAAPGTARTTGASKHPYWGVLAMTRLGAKPEKTFELRGLDVKIDVYLGQDPDEEVEDTPLTTQDLDAAAVVFASFVAGIDDHVVAIRTAAFDPISNCMHDTSKTLLRVSHCASTMPCNTSRISATARKFEWPSKTLRFRSGISSTVNTVWNLGFATTGLSRWADSRRRNG